MPNQKAEYVGKSGPSVSFTGVEVGIESNRGSSLNVWFPQEPELSPEDAKYAKRSKGGTWDWVPHSQIETYAQDRNVHQADTIQVSKWWADKVGLDYESDQIVT